MKKSLFAVLAILLFAHSAYSQKKKSAHSGAVHSSIPGGGLSPANKQRVLYIDHLTQRVDTYLGSNKITEREDEITGHWNVYRKDKDLQLIDMTFKDNNVDKKEKWYFHNGVLIYAEKNGIDIASSKPVNNEKLYFYKEELFYWTKAGKSVGKTTKEFKNLVPVLKAYAAKLKIDSKATGVKKANPNFEYDKPLKTNVKEEKPITLQTAKPNFEFEKVLKDKAKEDSQAMAADEQKAKQKEQSKGEPAPKPIGEAKVQMPKQNDLYPLSLTGKVKSMHETCFKAVDKLGKIEKGKRVNNEDEFESGNVFNADGFLIESTRFGTDGNLTTKWSYLYDDKSRRVEEDKFKAGDSIPRKTKFVYKYDGTGKPIEQDWLNPDGSITGRAFYKYDAKGDTLESLGLKVDSTVQWKTSYIYDDKGRNIETSDYKSEGKVNWKITYKINDSGKIAEASWYKNGTKFFLTYKYSYDSKGNIVEIENLGEDGKLFLKRKFTYDFDTNGNWTKRMLFVDDKPETITERAIDYF